MEREARGMGVQTPSRPILKRWAVDLSEKMGPGLEDGPVDLEELVVAAEQHLSGGLGFGVRGSGFRVQGAGFRVRGSGFRVQGSGFGVRSLEVWVNLF